MVTQRLLLLLCAATLTVHAFEVIYNDAKLKVISDEEGISYTVRNKHGKIGLQGFLSVDSALSKTPCTSDATTCFHGDGLRVEMSLRESCLQINTVSEIPSGEIRDCIDLGTTNWFGGPEQYEQYWPVEKLNFTDYSYIPKEIDGMAVAERYWVNSDGIYMYVAPGVPLYIDQNRYQMNSLCFIARNDAPYLKTRPTLSLEYSVCGLAQGNAREAHYDAIQRFLTKPTGVPDERMVRHPIWSTWARYKRGITQDLVLEYANEILANGFNNSQLEIDDNWETCYGSLTFDTSPEKFPDMRNLSLTLKSMGFRVTLWTHPFINTNCEPQYSFAHANNFIIKNANGTASAPWWNGVAGYIDFSNPAAVDWWLGNLNSLLENELIDSLKLDAGETSWIPRDPILNATAEEYPGILTTNFAEAAASFGGFAEIRVGFLTQHLPVFVRMLDKQSRWGLFNGLHSLITTLLQMNMNGYPLVLPDMIGGNGYPPFKPDKELFIRWLQANTFMPALQFSFVPWDFDQETVDISKIFTALHAQYTDLIMSLAQKAVVDGTPINPPIWWLDPADPIALAIDDEYLLGEAILVAPIVEQGATSRDVYLPLGVWQDANSGLEHVGPVWIMGYAAPLDVLPYFVKLDARSAGVESDGF